MISSTRPIIGITMGDPVGVGPEVLVKALATRSLTEVCRPVVFGDMAILERAQTVTGGTILFFKIDEVTPETVDAGSGIGVLALSNLRLEGAAYGTPTPETGEAMVSYIQTAVRLAGKGEIDAMVTGPINKAAMALAGYPHPGHTELLAEATETRNFAMMLAGDRLRVVLVTIHHALRDVPSLLSIKKIFSTIQLTNRTMKTFFGIKNPSIAVAALNPHAGEEGIFGHEETAIISPAVEQARNEGIEAVGPLAPDSLFYSAAQGNYDAVVSMYHDQGLIPLKLLHFDDAVNVTLGLPIIRTSVDHGTAYNIAGTGTASPKSMINAVRMAAELARKRE